MVIFTPTVIVKLRQDFISSLLVIIDLYSTVRDPFCPTYVYTDFLDYYGPYPGKRRYTVTKKLDH